MNDNSNNNVFSLLHPSNEDLESIFNNFINSTIIQTGWNITETGWNITEDNEDNHDNEDNQDNEGDTIMQNNQDNEEVTIMQNNQPYFFPVNNYIPLLDTSFAEDKPKYKYVISSKGLEQLKKLNFSIEKFKDQTNCPIKQEKFVEGEEIISLPCNHIFKKDGIMHWLEKENANCPVCRYKLDSKEEEIPKEPPINQRTRIRMTLNNLRDYIDRIEEERENDDIQRAIIASLADSSQNNIIHRPMAIVSS